MQNSKYHTYLASSMPRTIVLTEPNTIPPETINEWCADKIHATPLPQGPLYFLGWADWCLMSTSEVQRETDYAFICLSIFCDLNRTKPDRRVIMLFAFPFTDMNDYEGKCSKK